jgi:hypothetical protein
MSIGPFVVRERFVGAMGLRTCCMIAVCGGTTFSGCRHRSAFSSLFATKIFNPKSVELIVTGACTS